jgi:hypothetical protein
MHTLIVGIEQKAWFAYSTPWRELECECPKYKPNSRDASITCLCATFPLCNLSQANEYILSLPQTKNWMKSSAYVYLFFILFFSNEKS